MEGLIPCQPSLRLRISWGRGQASAAKVKNHRSHINRPSRAFFPYLLERLVPFSLARLFSCLFSTPGMGEARTLGLEEERVDTGAGGRKPQMILPGSHPLVAHSHSLLPCH